MEHCECCSIINSNLWSTLTRTNLSLEASKHKEQLRFGGDKIMYAPSVIAMPNNSDTTDTLFIIIQLFFWILYKESSKFLLAVRNIGLGPRKRRLTTLGKINAAEFYISKLNIKLRGVRNTNHDFFWFKWCWRKEFCGKMFVQNTSLYKK